jgi:hypothetical protein
MFPLNCCFSSIGNISDILQLNGRHGTLFGRFLNTRAKHGFFSFRITQWPRTRMSFKSIKQIG